MNMDKQITEVEYDGKTYSIYFNEYRGFHYALVDGETVNLGIDHDDDQGSFEQSLKDELCSILECRKPTA